MYRTSFVLDLLRLTTVLLRNVLPILFGLVGGKTGFVARVRSY